MTSKSECEVSGHLKTIIGPVEEVTIENNDVTRNFLGRVDTGAASSSVDSKIVAELKLGPILSFKKIRNAHGETLRPVVEANITLRGKTIRAAFTVADRTNMKYKVLIGRNILREGFLIDVTK